MITTCRHCDINICHLVTVVFLVINYVGNAYFISEETEVQVYQERLFAKVMT